MLKDKHERKIEKVGDLKEVLKDFDDNLYINFGTDRLGFEIDAYGQDALSLALLSSDLEEYLEKNDMS